MSISRQFAKFSAVGLASNAILYAGYLVLTTLGAAPRLAMSILYVLGVLQTFVVNRRWTFDSQARPRPAMARYYAMYGAGYIANFAILTVFVSSLGFPHQLVQLAAIALLAVCFFVVSKYWVFRTPAPT